MVMVRLRDGHNETATIKLRGRCNEPLGFWHVTFDEFVEGKGVWWARTDAMSSVHERVAYLAVLRELQVNKWTDIPTLRDRLRMSRKKSYTASRLIQYYAKDGGLIGIPQGIDPVVGYPYKRWEVDDVRVLRRVSREHHLPLMPPEGKQRIRARDHGHTISKPHVE